MTDRPQLPHLPIGTPGQPSEPAGPGAPARAEPALTPQQSAALIAQTQAHARRAIDVSTSGFLWAWGGAWLAGYAVWWLQRAGHSPASLPTWIPSTLFITLMVGALAYTATHVARHARGIRGRSAAVGTGYALAWLLGFGAMSAIGGALIKHGLPPDAAFMYWALAPAALVGVMYLAGALIWPELTWFITAALIMLAVIAASFAGPVGCLAVMALAGGGSMLVGAAAITVIGRKSAREARP